MEEQILDGWTAVERTEPTAKEYLTITLKYPKSLLNNLHIPSVKNLIACEFIDALEKSVEIRNNFGTQTDANINLQITF